jgi:SAM-dependent methyltransferase
MRPPRHDERLGVAGDRLRAMIEHLEVDHVHEADALLPHGVVEGEQMVGLEIEGVTLIEAGALPEDQPGTIGVAQPPVPVEEELHRFASDASMGHRREGRHDHRRAGEDRVDAPRPYYHDFAWAYDLLQTDEVGPRVDFVESILTRHGLAAGAAVLDAGCGTGRYAFELARRGYRVCGVDRSADLIAVARAREPEVVARPDLSAADLLEVSFARPFDAVLCRGVLNDFVEAVDRRAIFDRFAAWLRPGGILVFDVREWTRTAARYATRGTNRKTVALSDGSLQFQSDTALDAGTRRLHIRERFDVERSGARASMENDFVMGCWTADEIAQHLVAAGFDELGAYPAYGEGEGAESLAWSDRLVIVARRRPGLR